MQQVAAAHATTAITETQQHKLTAPVNTTPPNPTPPKAGCLPTCQSHPPLEEDA